jgi:hypothetical protein
MVIQAEVHHLLVKEAVAEALVEQARLLAQLQHFLAVVLDILGRIQEIPMLVVVAVVENHRIQAALVDPVAAELVVAELV